MCARIRSTSDGSLKGQVFTYMASLSSRQEKEHACTLSSVSLSCDTEEKNTCVPTPCPHTFSPFDCCVHVPLRHSDGEKQTEKTEKASEEERWTEWKRVTKLDSRAAKQYILMALSRSNLLPVHLPTKVVDVLYLELVAADCCRYWLHLNLPLSRQVRT